MFRLLDHWEKIRGGNQVPPRSALDPSDIHWALSAIWLMRFEPESKQFRYRLAGEDVQAIFSVSLAGKTFHDFLEQELADFLVEKFRRVIEEPAICHDIGPIYVNSDKQGEGERLVLPLAGKSGQCEYLLGYTAYNWDGLIKARRSDGVQYSTTFTPIVPDGEVKPTSAG